jgi:GntR family transcriptional regulator
VIEQPLGMAEASRVLAAAGALTRDAAVPLWLQLRQRIDQAIADRRLPPDSHLPSEHGLCRMFGVSRTVVREALGGLASAGSIVKVRRRGVFVARPRADQDFAASNVGFFGEMSGKGHKVTTRIFSQERRAPSAREAEMLALPPGSEVVALTRLAYADGEPRVLGTISLPAHAVPGLEAVDLADRSLYATLRERYAIAVASAERWFDAVLPTPEQAALLEITTAMPVIAIESRACRANGTPIEYYTAVYNGRHGRLHIVVPEGRMAEAVR